jgi:hypothetical protein
VLTVNCKLFLFVYSKAHVAALSVSDKQRLQAALQASSTAAMATTAANPGIRFVQPSAQPVAAKIQFNLSKFKA